MLRSLVLSALVLTITVNAQLPPVSVVPVPDLTNAERILLPSYNCFLPGVDGARWCTEFSVFNGSDRDVTLYPVYPHRNGGIIADALLRAQRFSGIFLLQYIAGSFTETAPRSARLVYVDRESAADLSFHLRLFDESRSDFDGGTEVPVVRESDLLDVVNLVPVRLDPRYRVALRVYDPSRRADARVIINIYNAATGELVAHRVPQLDVFERVMNAGAVDVSFPGLVEYHDLQASFPELSSVGSDQPLRIEVLPDQPSAKIWAMVSLLNIETHHVTLVTPQ